MLVDVAAVRDYVRLNLIGQSVYCSMQGVGITGAGTRRHRTCRSGKRNNHHQC
jgi:hypothetical protein